MSKYIMMGFQFPQSDFDEATAFYSALITPILLEYRRSRPTRVREKAVRYMLKQIIWGVTTCTNIHKHAQRYVSDGARAFYEGLATAERARKKTSYWQTEVKGQIQHEHVVTLDDLVEQMLAETDPENAAALLRLAEVCIVTVHEHERLSAVKNARGWDRYRHAGVTVWDRASGNATCSLLTGHEEAHPLG